MTKKKRIWFMSLVALLAFGFLVYGTFAFWRTAGVSENQLTTGVLDGTLVEEYEPQDGIYPGDTVPKIVNVKNDGNLDMIVRLKVEKAWMNNTDGLLDNELIEIDFNADKWLDGGDGYFYYKGILKPGEMTEEPLMEEFTLDASASNEYMGQDANIIISMDCLQSTANAVSIWGKSYDDLEVEEPKSASGNKTEVEFGSGKEFAFNQGTDLFASFKNMTPGETRNQTMRVTNSSAEKVEMFLRAEPTDANISEELSRFLQEHATIVVTDETGKIVYSGPIGGPGMHDEISLGSFEAGKGKELNVALTIDPQIENEYQSLLGNIKWVFTAQGEDGTTTVSDPHNNVNDGTGTSWLPKTGDEGLTALWIVGIIVVVAAVVTALVVFVKKSDKKSE